MTRKPHSGCHQTLPSGWAIVPLLMGTIACASLFPPPTPTATPTAVPPQVCYVDWNWGGATLEVVGPNAFSYCDALVAYGYRDYGMIFYARGDTYGESILCEFQGTLHYFAVWDEPQWEAGSEFCAFLGTIPNLP